jgi:hypothetical protein
MESLDRRSLLRGALSGAAVATVAISAGLTLIPDVAEAMPLAIDKNLPRPRGLEDHVEKAQVVVVGPRRRRRRRWACWWRRGRRVCGWRYW